MYGQDLVQNLDLQHRGEQQNDHDVAQPFPKLGLASKYGALGGPRINVPAKRGPYLPLQFAPAVAPVRELRVVNAGGDRPPSPRQDNQNLALINQIPAGRVWSFS